MLMKSTPTLNMNRRENEVVTLDKDEIHYQDYIWNASFLNSQYDMKQFTMVFGTKAKLSWEMTNLFLPNIFLNAAFFWYLFSL